MKAAILPGQLLVQSGQKAMTRTKGERELMTHPRHSPKPVRWACYCVLGFPGGATWTPRTPTRSIAPCTSPEALASSINSAM